MDWGVPPSVGDAIAAWRGCRVLGASCESSAARGSGWPKRQAFGGSPPATIESTQPRQLHAHHPKRDTRTTLPRFALSLPVSLCSVGRPLPEHIERNAAWSRSFKPMPRRERGRLVESIAGERQYAMIRFLRDHQDA